MSKKLKTEYRKSVLYKTLEPKIANQNNQTHVILAFGGMSSEREVSLMSMEDIKNSLLELGYRVTPVDFGYDFAEKISALNPDVVYNAMYGTFAEDGSLPGMLKIMNIKCTHSSVTASAIGMDKIISGNIFIANGIKQAKRLIIKKVDKISSDPMPRPYVIKPNSEGSSVGVEVIFEGDDFDFANYGWEYGEQILVEEYIPGREIQVAIFDDKAIGAIEIVTLKGKRFYDYEAKYTEGFTKHVYPAPISHAAYKKVLEYALKAHKIIGCNVVSRVDFRYNPDQGDDGEFYILEVNTHPGMTKLSLVPEICSAHGISFSNIVETLVKKAI